MKIKEKTHILANAGTLPPIPAPPEFSATPEAPHEKCTSSRVTGSLVLLVLSIVLKKAVAHAR